MFSSGNWSFPAKPSRLMMPLAILAHCGFPLVPWSGEIIVGCSQSSRIVVRMQLRKDADLLTETWFPGTGPWTTDPGPPCADRRPKNNARLRAPVPISRLHLRGKHRALAKEVCFEAVSQVMDTWVMKQVATLPIFFLGCLTFCLCYAEPEPYAPSPLRLDP